MVTKQLKGFYDGDGKRYDLPEPYDNSELRGLISTMANTISNLSAEITKLNRALADKVSNSDLTTKLGKKADTSTLNSKVSELNTAINSKVSTSTFNTKVDELNTSIDSKVSSNALDTKLSLYATNASIESRFKGLKLK